MLIKLVSKISCFIILFFILFSPCVAMAGSMDCFSRNINASINLSLKDNFDTRQSFFWGIMLDPKDGGKRKTWESYFQICNDLNMKYLKVGVLWDLIEDKNGEFNWKGERPARRSQPRNMRKSNKQRRPNGRTGADEFDYDYIRDLAQKYQVSIIPTFLGSKIPGRETDEMAFANFVMVFISRYKDTMDIRYVEFQNEPNVNNNGTGNGRHWKSTASDLARVNTAAYGKIKTVYPDIIVGTAGFITGTRQMINNYTLAFYESYFLNSPKFDVFILHDYPKVMNYTQGTSKGDFASQYHLFESYRDLLDNYGYNDKPILITEGFEDKPFFDDYGRKSRAWSEEEASTLLIESYMVSLEKASSAKIIGKIISGIKRNPKGIIGLINRETGAKKIQYYILKQMIDLLNKYPFYVQRVAGEVNADNYWAYMFSSESNNRTGKNMWVVFAPILYETDNNLRPRIKQKKWLIGQEVELSTTHKGEIEVVTTGKNGRLEKLKFSIKGDKICFVVGKMPVFVYEILD